MTNAEAGRLGGLKTYHTYGVQRCEHCGRLHDTGYMSQIAARGGAASGPQFKQRDPEYFSRIGKLGGRPRRQVPQKGAVDSGEGDFTSRPPREV